MDDEYVKMAIFKNVVYRLNEIIGEQSERIKKCEEFMASQKDTIIELYNKKDEIKTISNNKNDKKTNKNGLNESGFDTYRINKLRMEQEFIEAKFDENELFNEETFTSHINPTSGIKGLVHLLNNEELQILKNILNGNLVRSSKYDIIIESINDKALSILKDTIIEIHNHEYSVYFEYVDGLFGGLHD